MASPPVIEDPSEASRRAKVRVGVAAALLLTAVGILALLNQRNTTPEEVSEPAAVTQESISSTEAETEPAAATPETPPSISSPPIETPPPAEAPATPPPPPVPGKLPPGPAAKAPAAPLSLQEETGGTVSKPPVTPQPQLKPVAEPAPQPSPTPVAASQKPAAPKAFEVQLGVFTDPENAKQLQAKLAEHGIPSHTETRVQVGPFKTRAEADQAREKLRNLGIGAVIIPK